MQQKRKQHLFYKNGQLSSATGSVQPLTLFAAANTPLAERTAETLLTAANSQNSIVHSSHRNLIQNLTYGAYGHGHTDLTLGYTGQRYDRLTNCYHLGNGYRAFSPQIMRFLSPDSLSPFGNRTLNAYAYCMGDPINRHDPSGHMWKAIKASITQVGTGVASLIKKKEFDYRPAATAAVQANAELNQKYGFILNHQDAKQKHFKALAIIPELEANIERIKHAGKVARKKVKDQDSLPINADSLDNINFLDEGDQLNYVGSESKLSKHYWRLDKFTKSHPPQQAGTTIRGA